MFSIHSNSDHDIHDPIIELKRRSINDVEPVLYIEGAGPCIRTQKMQWRVAQKKKIALSLSKAPLKVRFHQKEETWKRNKNEVEAVCKQLLLDIRRLSHQ